jgi:NaMN:DMB phosphoribosyltransferase
MSEDEARRAVQVGIELAQEAMADGFTLLGTGEMGIASNDSAPGTSEAVPSALG